MTYSMTCSCGDKMTVDADTLAAGVTKLQGIMNEGAIAAHMAEKHPGKPVPTVAEIHADIAKNLK